jgi:hypothetical protein
MRGTHFPNSSVRHKPAGNIRHSKNSERSFGLSVSIIFHVVAPIAVLLWCSLGQEFSPEVIAVSLVAPRETVQFGQGRPIEALTTLDEIASESAAIRSESKSGSKSVRIGLSQLPTRVVGTPAHHSELTASRHADLPVEMSDPLRTPQKQSATSYQTSPAQSPWNAATSPNNSFDMPALVHDPGEVTLRPTVARRFDWEGNSPVEDNKVSYSASGSSPSKLTMREARSDGFSAMATGPGFESNHEANSRFFGLTPHDSAARSQRLDWTLVNQQNFGLTAFGYENEVGRDFRPFGKTKKEFAVAGSTTRKAGGEMRLGPFRMGLAQSSIEGLDPVASFGTEQKEASLTIDLPSLLAGTGTASSFVPTLWMNGSIKREDAATIDTVTTSFGGSWTWSNGYANVGYWNYSSAEPGGQTATAWAGQGFDANLGGYYSSFALDFNLAYGNSEDTATSWQSAGALYNSSLTLSYKPEKLPGVWAMAAAGNFDYNGILMGSTSHRNNSAPSVEYETSTKSEYLSASAGVDLSYLFWNGETSAYNELPRQHSFVKLLFQYNDNFYLDNAVGSTRSADSLVALMVQHTF